MKIKCNWSENVFNKVTDKLEIKQCQNTNTVKDKGNVKDRWFCIDKDKHIEEVIKTRKIMHKNCINKEKLIMYLQQTYVTSGNYSYVYLPINSENLIKLIENGEFDNE